MDFDLNAALTSINEVDIPYSVPPIPDLVQPSESNEGEVLEYTDANDRDIIHPALGMELGSADEAFGFYNDYACRYGFGAQVEL